MQRWQGKGGIWHHWCALTSSKWQESPPPERVPRGETKPMVMLRQGSPPPENPTSGGEQTPSHLSPGAPASPLGLSVEREGRGRIWMEGKAWFTLRGLVGMNAWWTEWGRLVEQSLPASLQATFSLQLLPSHSRPPNSQSHSGC